MARGGGLRSPSASSSRARALANVFVASGHVGKLRERRVVRRGVVPPGFEGDRVARKLRRERVRLMDAARESSRAAAPSPRYSARLCVAQRTARSRAGRQAAAAAETAAILCCQCPQPAAVAGGARARASPLRMALRQRSRCAPRAAAPVSVYRVASNC